MKKINILVPGLIAAGCIAALCAKELRASAETAFHSHGNFVTDDGKMAFYKTDLDYLGNEIASLENEIDYGILEQLYSDPNKESHQESIQSKGIIDYDKGKMVLDSRDMTDLACGLDRLENNYVSSAGSALKRIGTYIDTSGNISHIESSNGIIPMPTLEQIEAGISQSQSVDHLADTTPIIADNLTAGTAAWVNGTCIIGNGADNERAYKQGEEDGEGGDGEDMDIEYTYHTHVNGLGEEVTEPTVYTLPDPGGCYKASGHTHNKTGTCPQAESVGKKVGATRYTKDDGTVYWRAQYQCMCGNVWTSDEYPNDSDVPETQPCPAGPHYNCDGKTNTWKIKCGKNNGDIESAIIIIHKKIKE